MRRLRAGAGTVAGLAAVLLLAGCSSEEPPPVGADGSGSFRTADRATATLTDADGQGVARAQAQADVADELELGVRGAGLEPGRYRVTLTPGSTCEDAGGGRRGPRLPRLVVDEDGSASYSATVPLGIDDLDDGAALQLRRGSVRVCGVLADH